MALARKWEYTYGKKLSTRSNVKTISYELEVSKVSESDHKRAIFPLLCYARDILNILMGFQVRIHVCARAWHRYTYANAQYAYNDTHTYTKHTRIATLMCKTAPSRRRRLLGIISVWHDESHSRRSVKTFLRPWGHAIRGLSILQNPSRRGRSLEKRRRFLPGLLYGWVAGKCLLS